MTSRMLRSARSAFQKKTNTTSQPTREATEQHSIIATTYTSDSVPLSDEFLQTTPTDTARMHAAPIAWEAHKLREYTGYVGWVVDEVLTPGECDELIALAEKSATSSGGWRAALLNMGPGKESFAPEYRNSDRIVWDEEELARRLWQRCSAALVAGEGRTLGEELHVVKGENVLGERAAGNGQVWVLKGLNERLRFLRYGPGQFFNCHCDGSYVNPTPAEGVKYERSLITLQLYLNSTDQGLKGGATGFYSRKAAMDDSTPQYQVNAKPGRVLIFQHRGLYHAGEEVLAGQKFTMRTDLMYQLQ